ASAVETSTSELTASAGRGMRRGLLTAEIVAAATLLGDDVLERRPAHDREEQIVESEEPEVPAGGGDDARADGTHNDGQRERQEEQRQQQVTRPGHHGHRAEERADPADPEIREENR